MSILFCIACSIILLCLIFKGKGGCSNIILAGFVLRVLMMIVDINHIFPVLHSGSDSEAFHEIALQNSVGYDNSLTHYTDFLTIIYTLFFDDHPRLVAQFINIAFGVGILLIVRRCLLLCNVERRTKRVAMWVMALMPNFIIFSAILLREAWIEFFIALSLLFFVRWFLQKGIGLLDAALSIACVFAAAYMHAGAIATAVGYMIAFIIYRPSQKRVRFSFVSILFIAAAAAATAIYAANLDLLGGKFADIEEFDEELIESGLSDLESRGNSAYLQWLDISSPAAGIAALPLRIFYFMFSPIPFDWRGVNDIAAFLFDSLIYLLMLIFCLRRKAVEPVMKHLRTFLLTALLLAATIFSVGTFTAGTAIRHRAKFLSIAVVAYAVGQTVKSRRTEDAERKKKLSK